MPPNTPQGSAEPKLSDKLANEANEAAMLVFAAKSVQLTQKSLAAFLQRNLAEGDPALRARIGQLMETKLGEVLTALMLSGVATTFGGNLADKVGVSPGRMDALASKLRVHAMASGATTLLDELVDPLVAGLTELIRAMPAEVRQAPPQLTMGQSTRLPETEEVKEKVEATTEGTTES